MSMTTFTIGASEAARRLEISQRHLTRLAAAGAVGFIPTPYGRAYRADEIEKFAREREKTFSR